MNRIKYNFSLLVILIIFLVNLSIAIDSKTPEFITELSDSDYELFI